MAPGLTALVFAYACNPDQGSEPGAGAVVTSVISELTAEVTVITRHGSGLDPLQLAGRLGSNVRVVQAGPRSTTLPTYVKYSLWILAAARVAARLRREQHFDVIHHLTYGSDWFLHPLLFLKKRATERWVWGPTGGATYAPLQASRVVAGTGAFGEAARALLTRSFRAVVHRLSRRQVDVALALNTDSATSFRSSGFRSVEVHSNAVLDYSGFTVRRAPDQPTVVYASRGVKWKGLHLVITAMTHLPDQWRLIIAGPGTDTAEFRRSASGLGSRVTFLGALNRSATLDLFAHATVAALPSLHDSAPWAAAEAAGIGTPVACLDLGGVSAMAGSAALVVPVRPTSTLPERFAEAIRSAEGSVCEPSRQHTRASLHEVLKRSYEGTVSS